MENLVLKYGKCPKCNAPGVMRKYDSTDSTIVSIDICKNLHIYSSSEALYEIPDKFVTNSEFRRAVMQLCSLSGAPSYICKEYYVINDYDFKKTLNMLNDCKKDVTERTTWKSLNEI